MKTKIFITGGRGFIGSHLLPLFNESEFDLYCLTRSVTVQNQKNINWMKGGVETVEQHASVIGDCDFVIHLAGEISNAGQMQKTNVEGIRKILRIINPAKTKGIIYLSSAGIYNIYKNAENTIEETADCTNPNLYEKTKIEAEKIVQAESKKNHFRFVILRPTNVIGENDPRKKLLNLCHSLMAGRFLFIKKNTFVNYVYVGDVAKSIFRIIQTNDFDNEAYNLNSPMKLEQFIDTLKLELNCSRSNKYLPIPVRPIIFFASIISNWLPKKIRLIDSIKFKELTNSKVISNNKIQKHLGGFSTENLNAGLKNLVKHYRMKNEL